jgi:hypothetical protein
LRWSLHMQPWSMYDVMSLGILVALDQDCRAGQRGPRHRHVCDGSAGRSGAGDHGQLSMPEKSGSWSTGSTGKEASTQAVDQASLAGENSAMSLSLSTAARTAAQMRDWCPARPASSCRGLCTRKIRGIVLAVAPNSKFRRAYSLQRTWALVIAAAVCYIPANMLPMMATSTFASSEADTIMGGVVYLFASGSWPLALIVLIASVMVPLGKLVALAYLLISVQRGMRGGCHQRARLYPNGRTDWSLVDA